jgi:hypothetical protein
MRSRQTNVREIAGDAAAMESVMIKSVIAVALVLASAPAWAEGEQCAALDVPKAIVAKQGGAWVDLTTSQWEFLRGIYAVNPATPAGLPVGDRAAMAEIAGNGGALVFFIDGDKACTPMPVPQELVDVLRDVGSGQIKHPGTGS